MGPNGGPDLPTDQTAMAINIAKHGAGAFHQGGDTPPKPAKTATTGYLDPRFASGKRYMKKDTPKNKG